MTISTNSTESRGREEKEVSLSRSKVDRDLVKLGRNRESGHRWASPLPGDSMEPNARFGLWNVNCGSYVLSM